MSVIKIRINHESEIVTYSTKIVVDGNTLKFSVTKHVGYQKPYQLNHSLILPEDMVQSKTTLFEDIFYWKEDFYTNSSLNKLCYNEIVHNNYNYNSKKVYEIQYSLTFFSLIRLKLNLLKKYLTKKFNP